MSDLISIWTGRADAYDAYRPQPPVVILDLFTQLIDEPRPRLVVDLGSGTGLSTLLWAKCARQVIGIEPNADMLRVARSKLEHSSLPQVSFQQALSTQTGLPADSASIVTCSQSLHWMEPEPTFAEIARILRPGGLFAAYDYSWPPTVNWQVDLAYEQLIEHVERVRKAQGLPSGGGPYEKEAHLARMRASGHFRWLKEVTVHHIETGDAERFIGLTYSNYVSQLLDQGLDGQACGFDRYEQAVRESLSNRSVSFYFSYYVRMGIK